MKPTLLHDTFFEHIEHSNDTFTCHFHDTYTIGVTYDGLFKSSCERKTVFAFPHAVRIVNPGEIHGGDSYAWRYANFYPSVELLSSVYEQMYGEAKVPIFEEHIVQNETLYTLLADFFQSVYACEEALVLESKLIDALSYLILHYTKQTKNALMTCKDPKAMKTVVEYIHDHLDAPISLEALSASANVSKYHFLRLFKSHTGLTPHQYIIAERVNKAQGLILEGKTLLQAGLEVGFSDQSHFIRHFRRVFGYSPKHLLQKSNFILYPALKKR
jgi:AraC-like DNA-binding protein